MLHDKNQTFELKNMKTTVIFAGVIALVCLVQCSLGQSTPTEAECIGTYYGTWLVLPGASAPDVDGICLLPISQNLKDASRLGNKLHDSIQDARQAADKLSDGFNDLVVNALALMGRYQDLFVEVCDMYAEAQLMGSWFTDKKRSEKRQDDEVWEDGRFDSFRGRLYDVLDDLGWSGSQCGSWLGPGKKRNDVQERGHRPDLLFWFGWMFADDWQDWLGFILGFLQWTQEPYNPSNNFCSLGSAGTSGTSGTIGSIGSISGISLPCCTDACYFANDPTFGSGPGSGFGSLDNGVPEHTWPCGDGCCAFWCSAFPDSFGDKKKRSALPVASERIRRATRSISKRTSVSEGDFLYLLTTVSTAIQLGGAEIAAQRAAIDALRGTWERLQEARPFDTLDVFDKRRELRRRSRIPRRSRA